MTSADTAPQPDRQTETQPAPVVHANGHDPKADGALRLATVNVNGIRAAHRKGMGVWFAGRGIDILTLQEVRAPKEIVESLLEEITGQDWHVVETAAAAKGRAGVAIATLLEPQDARVGIGDPYFDDSGRWIETDLVAPDGKILTVVSAYVHSGVVDTPKQVDKYRFLDEMIRYLPELKATKDYAVVTGDLNVGHTKLDIKNWRGNTKKAGFLPEERAYFDRFFGEEIGYVDVHRRLAGDVDGPYTWWSQRGQAFDNDTGWRIDYQAATPELAAKATSAVVDRAPSYDTRFSDHAPLVVDYQF
ncbi:Exodeoxyribonuclease-3 [Citricoccus sp. K5]|nr:Exodeoxyribonuclease-3 [Citricoccus sp. K5]